MNEEVFKEVLSELSETDKELAINNGLLTKAVESFTDRLTQMENKIGNLKVAVPPPDLQPVADMLQKHSMNVEAILEQQPKQVLHEKRTILFPIESYKLDFYKKILGQFLKWLAIVIIVLVGLRYIRDAYNEHLSNAKYKQAWERLYKNQNKKSTRYLDSLSNLPGKYY